MLNAAKIWLLASTLALAALPAVAQLFGQPELLEPEKAFRISARALDERNVEVEFRIADGYYMYRDRFSFATESGKPLAEVEIPRGKLKEDQFFGKTETFRDLVRIRVPVSPEDAAKGSVNLKVTSQGCSDKGVCYVPLEQMVRVSLPGANTGSASDPSSPSVLAGLRHVPWLLLVASLAGGLLLGWASAGAPLLRDATAHIARAPVIAWALALAATGGLFGWLGSLIPGRSESLLVAAPLALAYVAAAGLWLRWSMRPGEFNWPARAARDVALLAAALLFGAYLGEPWIGAAATLGAGLACGLFPKARTEARHELALQAVALAMLAAAAWVAAPVLNDVFRMLVWSAWLVIAAMMLRAMDSLPQDAAWSLRLLKALGLVALVWGVAVLIGAASGARDPLRPFEAFLSASK
jgi:thiol:disulfide interchange protein DsbD